VKSRLTLVALSKRRLTVTRLVFRHLPTTAGALPRMLLIKEKIWAPTEGIPNGIMFDAKFAAEHVGTSWFYCVGGANGERR
jgi:hypothetical protein